MASGTRDMRDQRCNKHTYQNIHAIDGSLACQLDLDDRELCRAGEAAPYREAPRKQTRAKIRTISKTKVQVREAQHVSPMTVLGTVLVLGLSLLMLTGYIKLNMISTETAELREELVELNTENVNLTAQYQQLFDLNTIKASAHAAGMDKPSSDQVCYIDLTGNDSAVVYQPNESSVLQKVTAFLKQGVCTVMEYFS